MIPRLIMEKYYQDRLLEVHTASSRSLYLIRWKHPCKNLINGSHEQGLKQMDELIREGSPERLLLDFSNCGYFFKPENQSWQENLLVRLFENEIPSRTAIIIPENLLVFPAFEASRVALEMDRENVRYYNSLNQALAWLLDDTAFL